MNLRDKAIRNFLKRYNKHTYNSGTSGYNWGVELCGVYFVSDVVMYNQTKKCVTVFSSIKGQDTVQFPFNPTKQFIDFWSKSKYTEPYTGYLRETIPLNHKQSISRKHKSKRIRVKRK